MLDHLCILQQADSSSYLFIDEDAEFIPNNDIEFVKTKDDIV